MGYKNAVPDRWTEYIPVGRRIPGTRFIAFKVPLKNMYDFKLAPWQRFSPSDLIAEVKKQEEELGLIVDLTCTMRYYSPEELPQTVMYSKIFTVGHEVPSDQVITQFKRTVKQYLSQNLDNDKLVGVHCTHGLNRTGYLVCRYLIDLLSMEPSEAIEKFNSSRGHSIERSNYIDDLLHGKSRSNAGLDNPQGKKHLSGPPPCPQQPPQSHGNAGLDKPQGKKHLSGRRANSGPPPCPQPPPQSHGRAGLHKPQAKHQMHFSSKSTNPQLPPKSQGQARSYGHAHDTPRRGPKFPKPPPVQPSLHQMPGQVMRPQRGILHSGGRYPGHGPRMPPPGFPHPHMPGTWHRLPQMEDNHTRYLRGPIRRRHCPPRPFTQQYDAANGAPPQERWPSFAPRSQDNPGNRFPTPFPRSHQYGNDNPYQRNPKPGFKKKPKTERQ